MRDLLPPGSQLLLREGPVLLLLRHISPSEWYEVGLLDIGVDTTRVCTPTYGDCDCGGASEFPRGLPPGAVSVFADTGSSGQPCGGVLGFCEVVEETLLWLEFFACWEVGVGGGAREGGSCIDSVGLA